MKRKTGILALLLALLCLCACAKTAGEPSPAPQPTAGVQPAETAAPVTPAPTPGEEPEPELPPPPDIDVTSWEFLYAGPTCGVGRYHPEIRVVDGQYMDSRCTEATRNFLQAARDQGFEVYIGVGYRNWSYTIFWYEKEMRRWGSSYEAAQHGFAPGCSEHRTGLAFDVTDEMHYGGNYNDEHDETVADTEVYRWMAEHCAEYGFIVRYPAGKEEFYHRACYPGHFRYVGVEAAQYIMENDLCLEEFLALYGVHIA